MEENEQREIGQTIESELHVSVIDFEELGTGATGSVFKVRLDAAPFVVALKYSKHGQMLKEEYLSLKFLSDNAKFLSPKVFFLKERPNGETSYLCMQFYAGISAENIRWSMKKGDIRKKFATDAVDNLLSLHQTKNDTYGKVFSQARYDDWHAFYYPFAEFALRAAQDAEKKGNFVSDVVRQMEKALACYTTIFDEPIQKATLCHGDYWTPNLMVTQNGDFLGAIDPFQLIWADPEYDLFPLIGGNGKKLKLFETYCAKQQVSQKCSLKNEFYYLFSEVFWFTRTKNKYDNFLKYRSACLKREMKKYKIK